MMFLEIVPTPHELASYDAKTKDKPAAFDLKRCRVVVSILLTS
jgi:hypothetical protein